MPKLTKEKSDEILKLLREGYTNLEVSRKAKVSAGTVSKIKSRLKTTEEQVKKLDASSESSAAFGSLLSRESLKKLGAIQVVLGCGSLDETVDLLHKDIPKLMSHKYKAALDFHGTPADVFDEVLRALRAFEDAMDPKFSPESQARVLSRMGLTWYVKGLFDLNKETENMVQFMEKTILEYYGSKGWKFFKKSKKEVLDMDPSLEDEVTGDLVSIYSPRDTSWAFPSEGEDYFGVQTKISEKLAWINVMIKGSSPNWMGYSDENKAIS